VGLAAGYVIWVMRAGYLLMSLTAHMPAWQLMDPLPVLDFLPTGKSGEEDDDETLASIVEGGSVQPSY
jgi:hypothetical protein